MLTIVLALAGCAEQPKKTPAKRKAIHKSDDNQAIYRAAAKILNGGNDDSRR